MQKCGEIVMMLRICRVNMPPAWDSPVNCEKNALAVKNLLIWGRYLMSSDHNFRDATLPGVFSIFFYVSEDIKSCHSLFFFIRGCAAILLCLEGEGAGTIPPPPPSHTQTHQTYIYVMHYRYLRGRGLPPPPHLDSGGF